MRALVHRSSLLALALALAPALLAIPARAANSAPDVDNATFDTDEDKALAATLKARDADNDALTFRLAKPPKNGEATIAANGKLAYTPKKDWHGKDEIVFEVTDGKSKTTGKAIVEVSSVNDPPTAAPAEAKGQEDKPVKGQLVGKDVDGDPLTYGVADAPTRGTLDVDVRTGKWTLIPGANDTGAVKMEIRISDGTVDVRVPLVVTLEPQNDPPTAGEADELTTKEDIPLKGQLAGSDPDGDALTWTLADKPAHGTLELDNAKGTFAYTPAKEYAGDDGFSFTVSDGKSSGKGRVSLNVLNVNDPPTLYPLALEGVEDQPLKGKVLAKDFDGDQIYYSVKVDPKQGEADVDHTTGEVTYVPKADYFGPDTFTVEASDIAGGVTEVVTVAIKAVNDAPVATSDTAKGDEDQPAIGKLKGADVDKDALTFSLAKGPKNGTVEVKADGSFRFVPNAQWNGADAFVFEVSDGKAKAQGTLELAVKPVNDAPKTADVKVQTNEDTAAKGAVTGSDIDKDKLTYTLGKKSRKGKVTVDETNGSFVYQPTTNENGEDAFSIKVSDGTVEAEAEVMVAVAAVNDVPVAEKHEAKGDEDQPIKGSLVASDVDKDALTFSVATRPRAGTLELDARTGAYSYAPQAHFNGEDAFRFEVTDGKLRASADVKLTVAAVNDVPDTKNVALGATEDKPASGAVAASDIDKDKLTWSEAKAPQKGKVTVDAATGRFTYTPNANENGEDSFVIAVSDSKSKSDATVAVKIEPVNDVPVADAHENRGKEDEPIKGKLIANDLDKDALTYTAITKPRLGAVEIDAATGAYTYTPRAHENGDDTFRFEVTDGKLRASADVKLAVAAVNDTPEPKDLAVSTAEDKDAGGKLVATDIDKDALTFRLKKAPARGLVIVDDATGSFRYVPARDAHGKDSFVIETTDGFASADATVTVDVAPTPDAPLVDPRAIETAEDEPASVKLVALDPDGEEITFKILTQPRLATAEVEADGKTLKLTPRADQHGEDQVVVEATDGKHKVRAVIPVLIAARNDAPTIDVVTAETLEETAVAVALVGRDKDGDPIKLALVDAKAEAKTDAKADPKAAKPASSPATVAHAASAPMTLSGNVLHVVPRKDFAGPIEAFLTASDPTSKSAPVRVVITVVNVNDAPVAKDLALKGTPAQGVSGAIEATDVDAGDELTHSLAVAPRQGAVVIDDARTGRFTYTAAPTARGEDSFRIRVKDKAGASVSATVRVTIAGPKPVASAQP